MQPQLNAQCHCLSIRALQLTNETGHHLHRSSLECRELGECLESTTCLMRSRCGELVDVEQAWGTMWPLRDHLLFYVIDESDDHAGTRVWPCLAEAH